MDNELFVELLVLTGLALAGGGTVAWLWWRLDLGSKLLPPQRERAVPWGGFEVVAVFFTYFAAAIAVGVFFTRSGFFESYYGSGPLTDPQGMKRYGLWITVFALPFQLAGIILLLKTTCDVQLYQLGLTGHRCWRNVLLGFLAWIGIVPLIYALLGVLVTLYQALDQVPEKHPFDELASGGLTPQETILVVLAAVVVAPITEELLFRGVLQRYLMNRWWGGDVALAGAYLLAMMTRLSGMQEAVSAGDYAQFFQEAQPALFILAMLGVYLVVRRRWPSPAVRTIYGVALLFAAAHGAWPSPVPLFILGLVLGWLAHRTQSLVAPMMLHALFNSVGVFGLLFLQSEDPAKGKAEMTPPARPAAVSTSSLVPGS